MAFRDSIVRGITLVRQAIQSPDFVSGVSGWTIRRDGTVEFTSALIRGILKVIDVGGSIVISSDGLHPTIDFISPDGTNHAFINVISGAPSQAQLGINTGQYTPADGIRRYFRAFLADNNADFQVIKASNQSTLGSIIQFLSTSLLAGYRDIDAGKFTLINVTDGQINIQSNTPGTTVLFQNNGAIIMDSTRIGVLSGPSSADLNPITTVLQDIVGATLTIPNISTPGAHAHIVGTIDYNCGTAGVGAVLGVLLVDGVANPQQILMPNSVGRGTYSQSWGLTGLGAGSHTLQLQCRKTVNAGVANTFSPHSKLTGIYTDVG